MKIKIEFELEDIFFLFAWRKQRDALISIRPQDTEAMEKIDKIIDKIANQIEPIIENMEREKE